MKLLQNNHIWLNAHHTIRPSDEFLRELGAQVLVLLNNPTNCLPAIDLQRMADLSAPVSQAQIDAPALYLKVIRS